MGLILGTGVGGGLIFNGKPITGKSYITGEFTICVCRLMR